MRHALILVAALTATSMAYAGSLNVEMRTDLTSTSYNDAASAASTANKNNYIFNLHTLKLDGKGNIGDSLSYRLKFILNRPSVTSRVRESSNDWVEMAYFSNKLSDMVTITAGKFNSDIGGWEGITTGTDNYMTSTGYDLISGIRYHTGVKVGFTIAEDHNISLQGANQEADSTATSGSTTKSDQNRSITAIVYKGSFMDKTLLPVISYFSSPRSTGSGAPSDSSKNSYTNAGLRWTTSSWGVDLDYGMVAKKESSATTVDEDTTTTVAKVSYKMENGLTPAVKWFASEATTKTVGAADSKTKYDGAELQLDYKPNPDQNVRYHIVYNMKNTKPSVGDTQTTTAIIAGLTMYPDLLK